MIAEDHSPASVLDFEVKLRGIAEVHFDGNAGHALVQNLTAERRLAGDVDGGHHRSPADVRVITNVVAVHTHHGLETLGRTGQHHPHLAVGGKVQAARIFLIHDAEMMALNPVLGHRPGLGVNQQIALRRVGRHLAQKLRADPSVGRRHRFRRLRQSTRKSFPEKWLPTRVRQCARLGKEENMIQRSLSISGIGKAGKADPAVCGKRNLAGISPPVKRFSHHFRHTSFPLIISALLLLAVQAL